MIKAKFYTLDLLKLKWISRFTHVLLDRQHLLHTSTGFVASCKCHIITTPVSLRPKVIARSAQVFP